MTTPRRFAPAPGALSAGRRLCRVDGELFISDDTCSHGEASLSEGTVDGAEIECPWHSGKFCLRTGAALNFPAVTPIRVYPATVRDGAVFISHDKEPT
jgi:nitrite reductase/ring-hydroxylating ferredoxin subunit